MLILAAGVACGGDGGGVEPRTTGSLEIRTATTGEPPSDGYTVSLDGGPNNPIGANATLTISDLDPGSHVVRLAGLADGCALEGENPRQVSVNAGSTSIVSFALSCVPPAGSIQVVTITTGPAPTSYELLLDGASLGPIGSTAGRLLEDIPSGVHAVGLSGVPANCELQGQNPQSATVAPAAPFTVSFAITCTPPPAETGTLTITTSTTGADPDGYRVSVDGGAVQPIGLNTTITLANLSVGSHTVRLSGLDATCSVSGANPLMVTVTAGGTATASFSIACTTPQPTTGTLRIITTTSGPSPDPDGYTFAVDGGGSQQIGANASVTLNAIAVGVHMVQLSGIAPNCTVQGANPSSVSVAAGATAELNFAVTCSLTTGALEISTATTGPNPDSDGYALSVDDGAAQPIGSNATVTVGGLAAGAHSVALSGVADNCEVTRENPRTVQVSAGTSTTVSFAITCTATSSPPIAFNSVALGLWAIFVVNPDGTGLRNLTPDGDIERDPEWSPDGSKILFGRGDDLYIMNADGTDRTEVAKPQNWGIAHYRWSPDGRMIAFVDVLRIEDDFFEELWVVRADGTGKMRLAADGHSPTWAPDGRRIAYASASATFDAQIRIINSDGSGDLRLTGEGLRAFQPAWSPDGDRIAFVTLGDKHMMLINPDGTGLVDVTPSLTQDDGPTWSPDGRRIAFNTNPPGQSSELAVILRDGSGRTILTDNPGFDFGPAWSPDGSRIVFTRSGSGDSEIYVMKADGSGQTNLSNRPDTEDTDPDW